MEDCTATFCVVVTASSDPTTNGGNGGGGEGSAGVGGVSGNIGTGGRLNAQAAMAREKLCNSPGNRVAVAFARNNWDQAVAISTTVMKDTGAKGAPSPLFILAWASVESWDASGSGALGDSAKDNNNFFGLTYRTDNPTSPWDNSIPCPEGSYDGIAGPGFHACFPSTNAFYLSGVSALESFGDKYLNAFMNAYNNPSPSTVVDLGAALATAGYNPGSPTGYGNAIAARMKRLGDLIQQCF